MRKFLLTAGIGLVLGATVTTAPAKVSEAEAAKLGSELTPVGANPNGNSAGTIPEWKGASVFTQEMKDYTVEEIRAISDKLEAFAADHPDMNLVSYDPANGYADLIKAAKMQSDFAAVVTTVGTDKMKARLTITADNYKQYADKLSAGHEKLFELYPETYKMYVFPSVRGAYYPDEIYKWTKYNATHATLEGTDGISGAKIGFPFPIPGNGAQVIWNHKLKFRGSAVTRWNDQAVVDADGSYEVTKVIEDVQFEYANLDLPADKRNEKIIAYYLQKTVAPPRVAGQFILVHEVFGLNTSGRRAWIYNPGLGRVNRAPKVGYDNPSLTSDGLQFNDQIDMFNGSLSRYNWKLVGKKAMFIPYNSYLMANPVATYDQVVGDNHINQGMARYELHRVWVVEATLREGTSHQFAKRVFYVDEDSWSIAMVDCYDSRGNLWRFQEGHLLTAPFVPTTTASPEVIYDLLSGRYFVTAMANEGKITDWEQNFAEGYFLPSSLRRKARFR